MPPWTEWEDYQAGLYSITTDTDRQAAARRLLSDPEQFREAAMEMLRGWPVAARQNLVHLWSGRNAWLGQATCCYSVGASSGDTRAGWAEMTNTEQARANAVAVSVRDEWERGWRDAQAVLDL